MKKYKAHMGFQKDFVICKKHGKQRSVGNYDECEKCLIEDKKQQIEKLEKEEKRILGKRY